MATPTTTIAGIIVPDTPLVKAAIQLAKVYSPTWLFHHVMRSWLFAVKLAKFENVTLDEEALAVAALLHDVGLIPKYKTAERRFEVDGAACAVSLLRQHHGEDSPPQHSAEYFKRRLRELTVWDAIALHSTHSIAIHSIPEVKFSRLGLTVDFDERALKLLPDAAATIEAVFKAYPRLEMKDGLRECFCTLAREKPATTYDNVISAVGEAYVPGYEGQHEQEESLVDFLRPN